MISSVLPTDRRAFLQRGAALGGMGLLGGCVSVDVNDRAAPRGLGFRDPPLLAPMDMRPDRIMNITVCVRPFRAAGPRMDAETLGDKLVVHNYGHGGSGWSLSWGSAVRAVRTALAGGERDIAVIGCGALGLTAATVAQRAGARVTVYAKDRMPDARSARATGIWSPDSRIALSDAVTPGFPALWEELTRTSFRMHQGYLGLADAPVEWTDNYFVPDGAPASAEPNPMRFAHYGARVRDLLPRSEAVPADLHPFAVRTGVERDRLPMFNITEYGRVLMNDLLIGGARFETVEFRAPAELAALKQKVIINCTGYGARALWKDESIVPVRGQLAWLIPQPEVNYGVYYKRVGVLSRRDGMIVRRPGQMNPTGTGTTTRRPIGPKPKPRSPPSRRCSPLAGRRAGSYLLACCGGLRRPTGAPILGPVTDGGSKRHRKSAFPPQRPTAAVAASGAAAAGGRGP